MALRSILTKFVQKTKCSVARRFVTGRVERCRLPSVKPCPTQFSVLSKPSEWGLLSRLAGRYYTETFAAELRRRAALRFLLIGPWGRQSCTTSRMSNLPGFSRHTYLPTFALIGFSFLTRHPYADSPAELDGIISEIKETLKDTSGEECTDENIQIPKSWDDVEPLSFLAKGCSGAVFTAKCRIPTTAGGGPCEHSDDGSSLNTEQSTREIYGLTESLLDTSEESPNICDGSESESYYEDDFSILSESEDIVQVYPSEVHTWEFMDSDSLVDFKLNSQSEGSAEWSDDDISIISESEFDENTCNTEIPFCFRGPLRTRTSFSTSAVEISRVQPVEGPLPQAVSEYFEKSEEESTDEENKADIDTLQVSQSPEVVIKYLFNYDVESNYSQILKMFWNEALPTKLVGGQEQLYSWLTDHVKKKLPSHHNIVTMYNVFPGAIPDLDEAMQHFECALPRDRYPNSFGRNMTLCLVMKRYEMTLKDYLSTYNPSMKVRTMLLAQLLEGILHLSNYTVAHRDLKSNNILLEGVPTTDNSDTVPIIIQNLIRGLLVEDPVQRLDALTATNIVHVYLWGWPEKSNKKLKPFLLNLINEVKKDELKENKMNTECCLKKAFLERLNTDDLFDAALFVSPHHSFAVDLRKVIKNFHLNGSCYDTSGKDISYFSNHIGYMVGSMVSSVVLLIKTLFSFTPMLIIWLALPWAVCSAG
ncbi:PINK1 [Acanthosepion pharaonis]|uniref:non-specific serine/threonine protein kinase n=1 Tax=Acanthosepion pharaonis TaxID=158019 RepID=A0A812DWS9_ACAPH|nr:PINK1 [Sepia pharaonis]